jgi:hypothetical protein
MARRIAYGLFLGAANSLAVDAALAQEMQTFASEQAVQRHWPTPSYGSTHQARTITLRATLGSVARSAVITLQS